MNRRSVVAVVVAAVVVVVVVVVVVAVVVVAVVPIFRLGTANETIFFFRFLPQCSNISGGIDRRVHIEAEAAAAVHNKRRR